MTKQSFNSISASKLHKLSSPRRMTMTPEECKRALEVRRRREDLEIELAFKREHEGL